MRDYTSIFTKLSNLALKLDINGFSDLGNSSSAIKQACHELLRVYATIFQNITNFSPNLEIPDVRNTNMAMKFSHSILLRVCRSIFQHLSIFPLASFEKSTRRTSISHDTIFNAIFVFLMSGNRHNECQCQRAN